MRAIGYVRVSHEDQARDGVSLAAQRAQIKAYCRARRWQVVEIFADEGISGKNLHRPGLQRALAGLEERRAKALVVVKLDRLSRSVRDIFALVEETFTGNGASLVSIAENLDATTAMGKAFLGILAVLAQMERELASERTRAALSHVKATGRYLGRPPFGKRRDREGRLVEDHEAQQALRRARRLRQKGASWREICRAIGWTMSQARTRLDPRHREHTKAAWLRYRGGQG